MIKYFYALIGGLTLFILILLSQAMSFVLGPSTNTIMMCKEIEKAGYLADECFDFDGFLKDRHCKGKTYDQNK